MNTQNPPRPSRPLVTNVFGAVVAAAVLLGWPLGASAADQVVLNTADAGAGSLRQAIADATDGDSITFAPGLDGSTITLTSGQLLLNKSLSIDASALTGGIAVSGNNASRVFQINSGTTNTMNGLTITGGNANFGGGIHNFGTLTLYNTSLMDNFSSNRGGGIYNSSALLLNNCTISGNISTSVGGGIVGDGPLTLKNCTLTGNASLGTGGGQSFGGAIFNFNVPLTLINCTLSGNTAASGGGLRPQQGTVTIENTIIAGNTGGDIRPTSTPTFIISGANLIGDNSGVTVQFPAGPLVGTLASPLDPLLAPLGDYGGPTQTMPPLPGSPAIDAASSGPANDQRGTARPQGANFDLGAVERIPDPLKVTGITRLGDGSIQIGFTKPSGMTHSVLASTNLDLPFNLWSNLGPALETPPGSGQFQFTDSQATNYPRRFYVIEASDPSMVLVAGGTLVTSNELNGTAVSTFQIGRHEVTWGEWQEVRSQAASRGYDIGGVGAGCADDHPVHSVNWYDVLKWCNLKSEMEGLTPVYTVGGSTYKTGQPDHTTISQNLSANNGYRLPLEAEWEFAARGGNQTNGYTYAGSNDLNAVGWYRDNSGGAACNLSSGRGTWPVGQKAANELGLYDMSGNVWEWCWDQNGSLRHIRGGSWGNGAVSATVSRRDYVNPVNRSLNYGFRLARSSGQ